jgi:phage shock protein PspC (stress-responsive transcriptional regulator)
MVVATVPPYGGLMNGPTNEHGEQPTEKPLGESPDTGREDVTHHAQAGAAPAPEERVLRRSATKKVFGGVAGGLAERFDVDANVVRVGFVILALLWGLGIALYLAMWLLIPRSSTPVTTEVVEVDESRRVHWLRFAIPAAFVVLFLLLLASFHGAWRWSHALTLLWLIFLVVLAVAALFTPARRLTLRRVFGLGFLFAMSLLILVTGVFFLLVEVTGVPMRGGTGVRVWHPVDQAEVQSYYHGAIGETRVNLEDVRFAPGTWHVTATEAVGQLVVTVPPGVTLDLITHVGIGNVGTETYVLNPGVVPSPSSARLVLNLQVGIGKIQIERAVR